MSGIILNRLKMIIQTVHSQREIGIFESRLQYLSPNYVVSRNIFARASGRDIFTSASRLQLLIA